MLGVKSDQAHDFTILLFPCLLLAIQYRVIKMDNEGLVVPIVLKFK